MTVNLARRLISFKRIFKYTLFSSLIKIIALIYISSVFNCCSLLIFASQTFLTEAKGTVTLSKSLIVLGDIYKQLTILSTVFLAGSGAIFKAMYSDQIKQHYGVVEMHASKTRTSSTTCLLFYSLEYICIAKKP